MSAKFDLVVLSHLRWDFVYQRPQHLLSRCAQERRVIFVEEPVFGGDATRMDVSERPQGVTVLVPHIPDRLVENSEALTAELLRDTLNDLGIRESALWYYTAMAIGYSQYLEPVVTIYDAMDELSAFDGAHPELRSREQELFRRADLVFTGGRSLYESKRKQHHDVHCFPSSVDVAHFAQAKSVTELPADERDIPTPRIGFYGVVDERFDIKLLGEVAALRPEYHFVVIGPVVKIDPATLPQAANIHYLGGKSYAELPQHLAAWDVAMMPFAKNGSTRFISPTKTPEYLAAGRPLVSTSITDVVTPYGDMGLVSIADTAQDFATAIDGLLNVTDDQRKLKADEFLSTMSWDKTWREMADLITAKAEEKAVVATH